MDSSSDTSNNSFPGNSCKISSALQALQKQHEEKTRKIEELRSQIDSVKPGLEKKMKEPLGDKKEVFKSLSEKYNSLREEYNALLAEKSME
ncbi:uveal autoantigen with coiled-coil domain and ankyrin [Salix suchowensis]|nr:uveal autoantigen with coiled-coil domain and ankyrin [Salix suchowensis]